MLFQFLKLFGLDVPAKIDAVTAGLELRIEQATEHVRQVAQEAAMVAALSASAAIMGAMAVGVGLVALYRWMVEAVGPYAGLEVEAAILVAMAIILATAATIKGKSLSPKGNKLPRYSGGAASVTSDPGGIMNASAVDRGATEPSSCPPGTTPPAPIASASDVVEPLAFFLSKLVKPPSVGNPIVDELLRVTAPDTADKAIDRAANVIRHGSRTEMIVVLTGAAFIGWMLTRHSGQK